MKDLNDIILKKGDIVDYCTVNDNCNSSTIIHDEITFKRFQEVLECKITKIQRPIKYETIYEAPRVILDKKEKEYLRNVIRPFRNKIEIIRKHLYESNSEFISIDLEDDNIELPNFPKDTMYRGMEIDKEYTIDELGLFKE